MQHIKSIDPNTLPVPELHRLLLAAVAPRPIALASTINAKGEVNLSPFSFFNVFSANPPILIFSPARRGRNNTVKHTYENVKVNSQVVVNIVNHAIVEQMSLSSTEYDDGVNEFVKAGFTQVPSDSIKPPRVAESPVSFECEVQDVVELGDKGGAGNLVISKIVRIHLNTKYLNEKAELDTEKLDLVGRMGESWYVRASGEALFEIPKPIFTKGIGVDALPKEIRESAILTGNNLGRLGNLEKFPNDKTISSLADSYDFTKFKTIKEFHQFAQKILEAGETEKALAILLSADELIKTSGWKRRV